MGFWYDVLMKVIPFDSKLDKRQATFVIFYCKSAQPWKDYPADNSGRHDLHFPVCLMINRADGSLGFIGGMVEEGETLEEAARREVKEEIGHDIQADLSGLVAHDIGAITTHAFIAEVPYEQLRKIQEEATAADHFGSEITGILLPHLVDYEKAIGKGGGLTNLLQSAMAPSVREEMAHFLLEVLGFDREVLVDICSRSGHDLDELLS